MDRFGYYRNNEDRLAWEKEEDKKMFFTDNPVRDFFRHEAEKEEALDAYPVCAYCGEKIQQDRAVFIHDEWICDECLDQHRIYTVA